jgi:hypothetical protein
MAVTIEQVEDFREFALRKLRNGGIPSLEECLRLWREEVEEQETLESIRRGEADFEAGRYCTVAEAEAEIRRRLEAMRGEVMNES